MHAVDAFEIEYLEASGVSLPPDYAYTLAFDQTPMSWLKGLLERLPKGLLERLPKEFAEKAAGSALIESNRLLDCGAASNTINRKQD